MLVAAIALPAALQAAPAVRAPVVTGDAQVGATLTASVATPAAKGTTYLFQWQTQTKVTVKKKTVTKWVAIPGAGKATFVPPAVLKGVSVRACVKAKGATSVWKCSGAKVVAAALSGTSPSGATPAPGMSPPAPAAPTPSPPDLLSINYFTQQFITGSASTLLPATVAGGSGTKRFAIGPETLPAGITFDQGTGTFTGPAASAWNFRATQIAAGLSHTCALTTAGGVKCWGFGGNGQLGNGTLDPQSTPADVLATGGGTPLRGITQIAAGDSHTCALTTSGGVKCWGYGGDGGLGNGTTTSHQSTPVNVLATGERRDGATLSGVTQITAGAAHTCALTTAGGVKCWGLGAYGQLGTGTTPGTRSTPVNVLATGGSPGGNTLSGITQIAAGYFHTCALTTLGGVKCWGNGGNGRLGNGTTSDQSTPVNVLATGGGTPLRGISQITTGLSHACALTTLGGVTCWGAGGSGRLGNGTASDQSTPVNVLATGGGTALSGITQITAGDSHTCALTTSGGAKCWGDGTAGQLGNGETPSNQNTPVDVLATGGSPGGNALSGITQITAGYIHTCSLTISGGVKCWGDGGEYKLGNGTTVSPQSTPVDVTGAGPQIDFPTALTVTATDDVGSTNTAVTLTEVSKPWFSYPNTLLTMGHDAQQLAPVVRAGSGTRQFSAAPAADMDRAGITFDPATGTFTGPPAAAWNFKATQITAGEAHTCALTTLGGVKCWGNGGNGRLGNGAFDPHGTPVDVTATDGSGNLAGITQIAAGNYHTCALTTAGRVKCWGAGAQGRLGDGGVSDRSTPVDVVAANGSGTLSGITQISAGRDHTCALTTLGGVTCWGAGGVGQLGNGANPSLQGTPVDVVATGQNQGGNALSDITQIAAGNYYTCALTAAGHVKCWGFNTGGRLGYGDSNSWLTRNTPVDVVATGASQGGALLADITQITAGRAMGGGSGPCALTTLGGVKCWGPGGNGRLGSGATTANNQSTPVDVCVTAVVQGVCDGTPLRGISQIAAGEAHTCALTTLGGVKCWGFGGYGALGNGANTSTQPVPVDVCNPTNDGDCDTAALTGITQIASGIFHTCALTTSGAIRCWGRNDDRQLGNDETRSVQMTPVDVTQSGPQPGFPAELSVTVTDDTGSWTLGRVVLGTK